MLKFKTVVFICLILATGVVSCGPNQAPLPSATETDNSGSAISISTNQPTYTGESPTEEAITLLNIAATAIKEVQSYHFEYHYQYKNVTSSSFGDFTAPDRLRVTKITRLTSDAPLQETNVVEVGPECYIQKSGSDVYVISIQPNLDGCVAPHEEIEKQLLAVKSAEIVGNEIIDGIDTTHIHFIYDSAKSMGLETGSYGESGADVWIDRQTGFIHQQITYGGANLNLAIAPVTYSKINETIQPPIEKP